MSDHAICSRGTPFPARISPQMLPAARLRDLPSLLPGGIEPEAESRLHSGERLLFGLAERGAAGKLRTTATNPSSLWTIQIE